MDLPKRFRQIDSRAARIDRQLGLLQARLFWRTGSQPWEEVEIFTHDDQGLTAKNWKTGLEIEGYRHKVTVSKNWYENRSVQGVTGTYGIQAVIGGPIVPCELESQIAKDEDTYASLTLREIQTVSTFE